MISPRTSKTEQFRSLWNLGGLTVSQLSRGVLASVIANDVLGHAAELAYYCLFAIFPLILIVMTLFGMFTAQSSELQDNLLSYFASFLPTEAFLLLKKVALELASHASGGKLTFGIVSALWCVSGAISALISSLNSAYNVTESRPWLKVRAIAFGLSALILSVVAVAYLIGVEINAPIDRAERASGLRKPSAVTFGN